MRATSLRVVGDTVVLAGFADIAVYSVAFLGQGGIYSADVLEGLFAVALPVSDEVDAVEVRDAKGALVGACEMPGGVAEATIIC